MGLPPPPPRLSECQQSPPPQIPLGVPATGLGVVVNPSSSIAVGHPGLYSTQSYHEQLFPQQSKQFHFLPLMLNEQM